MGVCPFQSVDDFRINVVQFQLYLQWAGVFRSKPESTPLKLADPIGHEPCFDLLSVGFAAHQWRDLRQRIELGFFDGYLEDEVHRKPVYGRAAHRIATAIGPHVKLERVIWVLDRAHIGRDPVVIRAHRDLQTRLNFPCNDITAHQFSQLQYLEAMRSYHRRYPSVLNDYDWRLIEYEWECKRAEILGDAQARRRPSRPRSSKKAIGSGMEKP